eukprot:evm.model.scf_2731.1 EVM.evm.TU.scf_2731.1   scf_2731:7054-11735(-)
MDQSSTLARQQVVGSPVVQGVAAAEAIEPVAMAEEAAGKGDGEMQKVPAGPLRVAAVEEMCNAEDRSSSFDCSTQESRLPLYRGLLSSAVQQNPGLRADWASRTLAGLFTDFGAQNLGCRVSGQLASAASRRRAFGHFEDEGRSGKHPDKGPESGVPRLWRVHKAKAEDLERTASCIERDVAGTSYSKLKTAPCLKAEEEELDNKKETARGNSDDEPESLHNIDAVPPSGCGSGRSCDCRCAASDGSPLSPETEEARSGGSVGGGSSLMKINIKTCKGGWDSAMEMSPKDKRPCSRCQGNQAPRLSVEEEEEEAAEKGSQSQTICDSANALELFSDNSSSEDWTAAWVAKHPNNQPGCSTHLIADYSSDVGASGEGLKAQGRVEMLKEYKGDMPLMRSRSHPVRGSGSVVEFVKRNLRRRPARGMDAPKKGNRSRWSPVAMCLGATSRGPKDGEHQNYELGKGHHSRAASSEGRRLRYKHAAVPKMVSRSASASASSGLPRQCFQQDVFLDSNVPGNFQQSPWYLPSSGADIVYHEGGRPSCVDSLFSEFSTKTPKRAQFWPSVGTEALPGNGQATAQKPNATNPSLAHPSATGTSLFGDFSTCTPTRAQFWSGDCNAHGAKSNEKMERSVERQQPLKADVSQAKPVSSALSKTGPRKPCGEDNSKDTYIDRWIQDGLDAAQKHGKWAPVSGSQSTLLGCLKPTLGPEVAWESLSPTVVMQPKAGQPTPLMVKVGAPAASSSLGPAKLGLLSGMQSVDDFKKCTGVWMLDHLLSNNFDAIYPFMELGWWKRDSPRAKELFKLRVRGGAFIWKCDVLRLCPHGTRLPLSGVPVTQRRVDGRPGFVMAWVEARDEGVAMMATWGEPHGGMCEDLYQLSADAQFLVRTTTIMCNEGNSSVVRWVFSQAKCCKS